MRNLLKLLMLLLIFFGVGVDQTKAITKVVGVASNNTPDAIVYTPCTTFGYSLENRVSLPVGSNVGRFVRVDDIGKRIYIITDNTAGAAGNAILTVMTIPSLDLVGSFTLSTLGVPATTNTFWQGFVRNSKLFLLGTRVLGVSGCATGANNCLEFHRFNGTSREVYTTFTDTGSDDRVGTVGVDVFVTMTGNGLITYSGGTTANRRARLVSDEGVFGAIGQNFGSSAITIDMMMLFNGVTYIQRNDANKTMYEFADGSSTASRSVATSSLGTNAPTSVFPIGITIPQGIAFEGNRASGTAQRGIINLSTFTNTFTYPFTAGAGSTTSNGSFVDSVNTSSVGELIVHSIRDNAIPRIQRMIGGTFATALTESNTYTCSPACPSTSAGGSVTQQAHDFSSRYMRIFMITNESPAMLYSVKVCATGGPS